MKNLTKTKKIVLTVCAVIVLAILAFFAFKIFNKNAHVVFNLNESDLKVYVDKHEYDIASGTKSLNVKTTSAHHIIIVNKEGFWPWGTRLTLAKGTTNLNPFLTPKNISLKELAASSPEYATAVAKYWSTQPADNLANLGNKQVVSKDGQVSLKLFENQVIAEKTGTSSNAMFYTNGAGVDQPLSVFNGTEENKVRWIDFYQDRSDVAIVAAGKDVFALEISSYGLQNFHPIYEGASPTFRVIDSKSIYIFDNGKVFVAEY